MFTTGDYIQDSVLAETLTSEPVFDPTEFIHVLVLIIFAAVMVAKFFENVVTKKEQRY